MRKAISAAVVGLAMLWASVLATGAEAATIWWRISANGTVHISNASQDSGSESGSETDQGGGTTSTDGMRKVAHMDISGTAAAAEDTVVPATVQTAIATDAAAKYPGDTEAQRYYVAKQTAAWRELQMLTSADGVPQTDYDTILADAASDYPGDYAAQVLAIEIRVEDYLLLHGV